MTPTQKLNVETWVAALKSGTYPQAKKALKNEDGYCCLGVLCEINKVPFIDGSGYQFPNGRTSNGMSSGEWFEEMTGLSFDDAGRLICINDDDDSVTFAHVIADIEAMLRSA